MAIHRILGTLLVFSLSALTVKAQTSVAVDSFPSGKPQSVGLVLSGGGAKGIAHIGVIRALEEHNIPIDYIAGTSMGSIVGGLYASGYTTDEMMELLLSEDFGYWSTGQIDPYRVYYFSRQERLPTMYTYDMPSKSDSVADANAVPASLINPLPMNFAFMELFSKFTAQCGGDFNKLFVPFRCVASDVAAGHKVVHSSGSLGDAIRTSMSFPVVFQPIEMNGALLYDGGIFDNFPVDVMTTDFAPDIMIGVDVAASADGPQTSLMDQIENLVMRKQSYDLPADKGIKIRINLDRFSLLDFPAAKAIEKIGYDHAMMFMDSICTRVTSRISPVARETARGVFKSKTPAVIFDSVDVKGGNEKQDQYIKYLFEPAHADTFGLQHARESFYRAITPGRLRDLFPQAIYNPETDRFTLDLKASVKNKLSFGIGGYLTSATNSYIFLSAGLNSLTSSSINSSLNGWIGQSYMAGMFNASINLRTSIPSSIGLTGVVSRQRFFETDHLFYVVKTPTFILEHEYFARAQYTWAAGWRGKMTLSAGFGHLYTSFFRTNSRVSFDLGRDHTSYNLGQVRLDYRAGTLDNYTFPTKGNNYNFVAMGVLGKFRFTSADELVPDDHSNPHWIQVESQTRNYFDISKHFSFGIESDVLWSTRPLHHNYNAAVVTSPAFNPTPASYNAFNSGFRSNSFLGVTIVPIYKITSSLSTRLSLSGFLPFRKIEEGLAYQSVRGRWFRDPEVFGEVDISYSLPFATVSGYVNYATSRGTPWSVGITFGTFILAPKFLR